MRRLLERKVDDGGRKPKPGNWRSGTRHRKRIVVFGIGFVGNNSISCRRTHNIRCANEVKLYSSCITLIQRIPRAQRSVPILHSPTLQKYLCNSFQTIFHRKINFVSPNHYPLASGYHSPFCRNEVVVHMH